MVFMSIFNFLEPSITIIVQAIPMFRVLVVQVKKATTAVRITSATRALNTNNTNNAAKARREWSSKILGKSSKSGGGGGGGGGTYGGGSFPGFSHGRSRGGSREEPDEALLHVIHIDRTVQVSSTLASSAGSGASSEVIEDKMYDGTLRQC